MLTRREQWIKWSLYGGVVLMVTLLVMLVLHDVRLFGVQFFLPPLFVGVVASLEDTRASMIFGMVYGALCDVTLGGTAPCIHTVAFVLAALLCAALAQSVIQPGVICSILVSILSFVILDAANILVLTVRAHAPLGAMLSVALRETAVSCLLLPLVYPVLMRLHKKFVL